MAIATVRAGLVAVGLVWALAGPAVAAGEAPHYVKSGSRAAGLAACVEPTGFMRRNHMELIKHQRDATVHLGIRSGRHSLAGCIDCHVGRDADGHPVAVNAERQFCNACHTFAAVRVTCFDCHAAIPRGEPLNEAAARGRSGPVSQVAHPGSGEGPAVQQVQTGEAR